MNENVEGTLPADDMPNAGPTEQELLDAVMANSPIADELGLADDSLPDEEIPEVDPTESEEEVEDPESEEVEEEGEEEEETEEEEAEAADDTSTQDAEAYALDDLEDFSVMVKIDGEESAVSIQDLVKGYSTEQSLSKKGRELGEARKALEAEREEKLAQLDTVSEAAVSLIGAAERSAASEYHKIEEAIEKARKEGDTYEVNELKDKREQAQKKYWSARKHREGLMEQAAQAKAAREQEQWEQQMTHFHENIGTHIPDFNEDVALQIRDFAVEEGLSEEILASITDPIAIKMMDDYRRLKQGVSKGAAKRKATPAKKAVPTKKARPATKKAADKAKMTKARAMREDASQEDQMNFLRDYASKSLNL